MKSHLRIVGFALVLLTLLLSVSFASQPFSANKKVSAATSCYGQAFNIGFYGVGGTEYEFPARSTPYVTSSYCNDINIKITQAQGPAYGRICFVRTGACNGWKYITVNEWRTLATDVLDGTTYVIQFQPTATGNVFGLVAD